MKFRRKPVVRDVVDAIKDGEKYVVQHATGTVTEIPTEIFERDYEPAKRDYVRKPKKAAKKKADAQV